MLENHSFDNVLGYLWANVTNGKSLNKTAYEGLQGQNFSNPIPNATAAKVKRQNVWVYPGKYNDLPYLGIDPGEEYGYINTEIYNNVDPQNLGKTGPNMVAPYNIPSPLPAELMQGFVWAYINDLNATQSSLAEDYNSFSTIMSCLPNSEIPVLTTIAQNFAVFDHWFCDIPSQTDCNRQMFISGTSNGNVINSYPSITDFATANSQPTIFDQLTGNKNTWKIYYPQLVPFTLLLNFGSLKQYPSNFVSFDQFFTDLQKQQLPDFSFLEPSVIGIPNDYHPSDSDNNIANHSSIIAGEQLVEQIYNAIKNAPLSYREQILFVITFDESGGTFDHVAPGPATPPDNSGPGQMGFPFDRLGVRVPMIWVNDYIQPGTTVQQQLQHTSFMGFLRTLWNVPGHLTARDASAPPVNLSAVFSNTPRSSWPTVAARNISNPGNASNADINEFSAYVNILKGLFEDYLNQIECDIEKFFGAACVNAATSTFSPSSLLIVMVLSYVVNYYGN